jgi:hypothetical protein
VNLPKFVNWPSSFLQSIEGFHQVA